MALNTETASSDAQDGITPVPAQKKEESDKATAHSLSALYQIYEQRQLSAVFQPIVDLGTAEIVGYEGLVRGPVGNMLHMPARLFSAARRHGMQREIEHLCRQVVLETFTRLQLPARLFMNVSPDTLLGPGAGNGELMTIIQRAGLSPNRVTIELTENQRVSNFETMRQALLYYRSLGFEVAIDDLGEGFSSLRLWSELHPEFVKIDKHFIGNINSDPLKLQFVKSIYQIAECCGTRTIAEGIETAAECTILKNLGLAYGQGYFIARPIANPSQTISAEALNTLSEPRVPLYPESRQLLRKTVTAGELLICVDPVTPEVSNEEVYALFDAKPDYHALAVVRDGVPIGIINRHALIDRFARPYRRELYGKKSCSTIMNPRPLVVEHDISIQDLSRIVADADSRCFADGFVVTRAGKYLGIGTGQDLVRKMTELQIEAARHANPLTLLPGNVPIAENIERLLEESTPFYACYCDLNYFKPFNDNYGYRRGDEMIELMGHVLSQVCQPERDFVGHIGGDDFLLLMQSADWEQRCRDALTRYAESSRALFTVRDLERDAFVGEDRSGNQVVFPLTSMSIGAVLIEPGSFISHQEVSEAAAEAKKQAKRMPGHALFVERRKKHS